MSKFLFSTIFTALVLTGCASIPHYPIDTTHRAIGQSERIEFIILHYTAEDNDGSLKVLTQGEVSSHYLIPDGDDDKIYQLVDDNKRAWHAGRSSFRGKSALNDTSLGIEIVSDGIKGKYSDYRPYEGFVDFQPKQIAKVAQLISMLSSKYAIDPTHILGHSDIAPNRKIDPGAKFPWEYLYRTHGIGAWYDDADKAEFLTAITHSAINFNNPATITEIKAELQRYGYTVNDTAEWDRASQNVIYAFQLHFRPRLPTGVMDAETYAILQALNKKYRPLKQ